MAKSFHCGEKQCEIFVACWSLFAMIAHDKSNHDEGGKHFGK